MKINTTWLGRDVRECCPVLVSKLPHNYCFSTFSLCASVFLSPRKYAADSISLRSCTSEFSRASSISSKRPRVALADTRFNHFGDLGPCRHSRGVARCIPGRIISRSTPKSSQAKSTLRSDGLVVTASSDCAVGMLKQTHAQTNGLDLDQWTIALPCSCAR